MKTKHPTDGWYLPMLLACLLGGALMFAGPACQQPTGDGGGEAACTTNDDCPDGQVCQDGQCVAGPECTTNEDCSEGQTCQDGECVEAAGNIEAGETVFVQRCRSCHGDPGMDNGAFASDIIGADASLMQGVLTGGDHPEIEGLVEGDFANVAAYLAEDGDGDGAVEFPYATTAFDHPLHMGIFECTNCHHAEPVDAKLAACDVCHLEEWLGGVPRLKEAMHTPRDDGVSGNFGCRGCHDTRTEGGLWACNQCHRALNDL